MSDSDSQSELVGRGKLFLSFLILELAVFVIIPLSMTVSITVSLIIHVSIIATFFVLTVVARQSEHYSQYFPVLYALLVAGIAVLTSTLFSEPIVEFLGFSVATPYGTAVAKFVEAVLRIIPLIVLMTIIGVDRQSMYLNRGRLGIALVIGIIAFIVFPIIAFIPLANQVGILDTLLSLSPWILLFVLSNGFMEELLFRGLFLKRYSIFLSEHLSNLLAAIVFTVIHTQVTYAENLFVFLILIVFPLSLIWGYLTQKTESILGAALFHAAGDCLIVFSAFVAM